MQSMHLRPCSVFHSDILLKLCAWVLHMHACSAVAEVLRLLPRPCGLVLGTSRIWSGNPGIARLSWSPSSLHRYAFVAGNLLLTMYAVPCYAYGEVFTGCEYLSICMTWYCIHCQQPVRLHYVHTCSCIHHNAIEFIMMLLHTRHC